MITFPHLYLIVLANFWSVYGLASIISLLTRRENGALLASVVSLFVAVFCGYGPTLQQASNWGLLWLWDLSHSRWYAEALYNESLQPFQGLYDIDLSAS